MKIAIIDADLVGKKKHRLTNIYSHYIKEFIKLLAHGVINRAFLKRRALENLALLVD